MLKHVAAYHLPSTMIINSYILIACDNTYIMESKDELVFVEFFFHPIPFVVCN
jgi:hypothetical protein